MKFSTLRLISSKNFYISTPIFYVNSQPHIGHLYTALLADAFSRWKQIKKESVVFSTGTDEHGYKIQKKAAQENLKCLNFCDKISSQFKSLFDRSNIKYSDYIRTTQSRHKTAVIKFWKTLDSKGFIYKSSYSGWYSVNDECFLRNDEVEEKLDSNGNKVKVSMESGHVVEFTSESNYMFRLSEFKSRLRNYLSNEVIIPKIYLENLYNQIDNLEDLSVSRESSRLFWGIPVPSDESQIIYVWLDALVNYLTVAGYPDKNKMAETWPADVHVIGKDILRFHAIYWPAFLMAAGLSPPKKILCHGHWLVDNRKMSKSIGNVVDPFQILQKYNTDAVRYYLLREGVPGSDCNLNLENFSKFINVELANTLGNLYQRCVPFNKELIYPLYQDVKSELTHSDIHLIDGLNNLRHKCDEHFEVFNFYLGIQEIMSILRLTNSLVQEYKPWELVKSQKESDKKRIRKMLFLIYESLRISAIVLQPMVPDLCQDLLERLNVNTDHRFFDDAIVNQHDNQLKYLKNKTTVLFRRL
ncbi:methionine--tRNA mitochondrial [Brachionus plicatilis]|uniref:Methionine--tRNA ligase, mitochondrial n=1 Tax=Brachionus plicatilis TaxID=10195 RepID=A0A3M7RPI7_BRAPC|nr:methionine--tRNA mitochondrial [Brachionus plicatilis]